MQMPSFRRGTGLTAVMSSALVALVIATLALSALLLKPPAKARFEVGAAQATQCPTGGHAPACYKFPVTNAGTVAATMQCVVTSAEGNQALFLSDLPTYVGPYPVSPGSSQTLWVKVDPGTGGTVKQPAMSCAPT